MKIPPANPLTTRPTPEPNRAAGRRVPTDPSHFDAADEMVEGGATERDFASVFDEVVSRPEPRREESSEGDRRVSKDGERAEHEPTTRRREEREGGSNETGGESRGGGFEHRATMREVSVNVESTSARSILHVADLERIVSAVRSQLAEGRHVVTIELRRSVLEGLKVKLSADAGGRVTAEFIAASERVRSQLDARAGELAELLRGRGVNLAELRTGVEAGTGGEGGSPREELSQTVSRVVAASTDLPSAQAVEPSEEFDGDDEASTYRA